MIRKLVLGVLVNVNYFCAGDLETLWVQPDKQGSIPWCKLIISNFRKNHMNNKNVKTLDPIRRTAASIREDVIAAQRRVADELTALHAIDPDKHKKVVNALYQARNALEGCM